MAKPFYYRTVADQGDDGSLLSGGAGPMQMEHLPGWSGAGPVVWGSLPLGSGSRQDLLLPLLQDLDSLLPPARRLFRGEPLRLEQGPLGRPLLFLGNSPGPSISYSQAGGRVYAALAASGQVGLDVAFPEEFRPPYPLERIFRPQELHLACSLCQGETARAAALLWALKEATLKARGEGFHILSPGEVEAGPPRPWEGGLLFPVAAGVTVLTWAHPQDGGWLAVGLWNPPTPAVP